MSKVYKEFLSADATQNSGALRGVRALRLLVLIVICAYLPLEAFDADAVVGFDDIVLQVCDSFSPSDALPTETPKSLEPLGFGYQRVARFLKVSCLCARSCIAGPPAASVPRSQPNALVASKRPPYAWI